MINNLQKEGRDLVMRFTSNAYNDIINTIGRIPAESGGLLFGYLDDYVVREFIFDEDADTTRASYTINIDFMNRHVRELWDTKQLACIGFIHSHPFGLKEPSFMDVSYFRKAFKWMPREKLLVPIVSTIPDGGYNLNPCMMFPKEHNFVVGTSIEIIVEPHVSKYDYIINPPYTIMPQSSIEDCIEGSDCIDLTGWTNYSKPVENKTTKFKETLTNFLDYILDGLFPYK